MDPKNIKSLTGNIWRIKNDNRATPENIAEILLRNRGHSQDFLNATLRNSMPDPYSFIDMEKAVNRICNAISENQPIAILGDYDVDGISSTCVFLKFFKDIGIQCCYTIPNRMDEGYGLNISNIEKYKDHLIIAVDCGSSSIDELNYARKNGIDVIVIDHHKMTEIPEAVAIVNPHRPDEQDTFKHLCATGLVFMSVVGINRLLREKNFYENKKIPQLMNYLDLVALATVCDVVALKNLNRAFVINGLKIIRQRKNLGINALLSLKDFSEINSETISFFIGPHLNAAGRLKSADISVKLLTTEDFSEAQSLALELYNLNKERQALEAKIFDEAVSDVDENLNFICAFNPNWHVGIIGIAAGRLKEKFNKPTIVITCDKNGFGKASCRSVENLDISAVIKKAISKNIIASGGGHFMAAGFSLPVENIPALKKFLQEEIQFENQPKTFDVDAIFDVENISMELIQKINTVAPFGQENESPNFIISDAKIISAQILKEQHISVVISNASGNTLKGITFRSVGTSLGDILLGNKNPLNFLGELSISFWKNNPYVNFTIKDVSEVIS